MFPIASERGLRCPTREQTTYRGDKASASKRKSKTICRIQPSTQACVRQGPMEIADFHEWTSVRPHAHPLQATSL